MSTLPQFRAGEPTPTRYGLCVLLGLIGSTWREPRSSRSDHADRTVRDRHRRHLRSGVVGAGVSRSGRPRRERGEPMKLTTRRTLRQWFLDAPYGTFYGLIGLGAALIGLGIVVEADAVALVGFLGILGWPTSTRSPRPTRARRVGPLWTRPHGATVRPAGRVSTKPKRRRRSTSARRRAVPTGQAERIERSPPVATIADGGEMGEADQDEVRG